MMRRFLLATTASLALSPLTVFAGGVIEPAVAPAAVAKTTTASSAGGYVVPLILLLVLAAAVASNSGSTAAAPVVGPSDRRLKTDIRKVGTTRLGLPLYQFRYHDLPEVYEGVMAQDVAIMHPGAIKTLPHGYMAVDYAKLGLQMRRVA